MKTVPNFALYGTHAQPSWADLVHFERITDRSSLFDWEIKPHFHDGLIQVLYPTQGSGHAFIDGKKWPVQSPCIIIAPARSVHGFHFSNDIDGAVITAAQRPLESLASMLAPDLLKQIKTPIVFEVNPENRHVEALAPLFDAIERESTTSAAGQVAAGMSLLIALFIQIFRIQHDSYISGELTQTQSTVKIDKFKSLLDEHCRERYSVDRYAQILGVTAGQLTRLCHKFLGMSALDAINARVIHEAQRELVYSTLSIKQISAELGFDDEGYFGRFFKKHTGLKPTDFRNTGRQQLLHKNHPLDVETQA